MPTPADLRNLGRDFVKMLAKLEEAGINVDVDEDWMSGFPTVKVHILPMTVCHNCGCLSPAAACLWCTPAEECEHTGTYHHFVDGQCEYCGATEDAGGHG